MNLSISMISAVARAEIVCTRRLRRYWLFSLLALLSCILMFALYTLSHDLTSSQAATLAASGIGAYQPFVTAAQQAATDFGTGITAAQNLTGTGAGTGTGSIASFMSPYQQQVIDTTLAEFDRQAQIRKNQQAAQTLGVAGAFGGGREGVQRAEFDAASNRNRAALQAGLLQQGFEQAQAARQQAFANQQGLANLQAGLGARQQDLARTQISGLGT